MNIIKKVGMAFALASSAVTPTPVYAQTPNTAFPRAPDLNRAPTGETNRNYATEAERNDFILRQRGYEFARDNYQRLKNSDNRADYGNQVTNPYNGTSVTNRLNRRFGPERLGGGVGRVLGDFGISSGTVIGSQQSRVVNDRIVGPRVLEGYEAYQRSQEAERLGDMGQAQRLRRVADDDFRWLGQRLDKNDFSRSLQSERIEQRGLSRTLQRFLGRHPSPLRGILPH